MAPRLCVNWFWLVRCSRRCLCKNKQKIPQIHRVNIERCILGSARSSPSQINLCFQKKKTKQKNSRQRFFIPLLLPLICTLYRAGTSNKPHVNPNKHNFYRIFQTDIQVFIYKMTKEAATSGTISLPQLFF